jgi:type IV pilus assembly protein PilB
MYATLEALLAEGIITDEQEGEIRVQVKTTGKPVEDVVESLGIKTVGEIYDILARYYGMPLIKTPYGVKFDSNKLDVISVSDINGYKFMPILINEESRMLVYIARNQKLTNFFLQHLGEDQKYALCTPKIWESLHTKFIAPLEIDTISTTRTEERANSSNEGVAELKKTGRDIPDLLVMILSSAVTARASDIQIVPSTSTLDIYFKIDGVKHHFRTIDKSLLENLTRVIAKDASMKEVTITKPAVGMAQYKMDGGSNISVRVNMLKTPNGVDINMRILDNSIPELSSVGFNEKDLKTYRAMFKLSKGIVLITGPTGSGKSTTLYSGMIDYGVVKKTIMSVEDPIEYVVPGVTQVEINEKEGNTFLEVTKGFLRHNPDMVLVGEIRDLEVANEACKAASTGHLVFSTLHTNDSIGAISRLLNIGVPGYTLAESLAAVFAQRLVRKVCKECRIEYKVTANDEYAEKAKIPIGTKLYKHNPEGCDACQYRGYSGRTAIVEIFIIDNRIRALLESVQGTMQIRDYVKNELKTPMLLDSALEKVKSGETTLSEVSYMLDEIL